LLLPRYRVAANIYLLSRLGDLRYVPTTARRINRSVDLSAGRDLDVVVLEPPSPSAKKAIGQWVGCISGTIPIDQ
jgi:hypothetical protein